MIDEEKSGEGLVSSKALNMTGSLAAVLLRHVLCM